VPGRNAIESRVGNLKLKEVIVEVELEIDDKIYTVNVPNILIEKAEDFFTKMDADMDKGWQMSRSWVSDPDQTQRCQIVADKLLTAITSENESYASLLCAYILKAKPLTKRIQINTNGEIQGNGFYNS
jgi:hypothetical protein